MLSTQNGEAVFDPQDTVFYELPFCGLILYNTIIKSNRDCRAFIKPMNPYTDTCPNNRLNQLHQYPFKHQFMLSKWYGETVEEAQKKLPEQAGGIIL